MISVHRSTDIRFPIRLLLVAALAAAAIACTAPTARAAAAPGFVGVVADDAFVGTDAYQDAQLATMQAAGVTLVRRVLDWHEIELRPGAYDWSAYDRFIGAAARHGIEVMPIVFNPPEFRSAPHKKPGAPKLPRHFYDVAAFAAAAVDRYGSTGAFWSEHPDLPRVPVRRWQIWNEPNLAVYWPLRTSARDYATLLRVVAPAIRRADPQAQVLSAGLAESQRRSNWAIPLRRYVRDFLKAGGGRSIDALAINAYAETPDGVVDLLRSMRRTLDARRLRRVRLHATEVGWSTLGPLSLFRTTYSGQARNIGRLIPRLGAAAPSLRLDGFVYYAWRDAKPYAGGRDFWGLHTGLLRLDGRPKPGMGAFVTATRRLSG